MLNLIITSYENHWTSSPAFFEKDRSLTEYILPELKEKYASLSDDAIEELKQIPCIFAYEKQLKQDAYIGKIKRIESRQSNVLIEFELSGEKIAFEDLTLLTDLLDMHTWEWNRTHWTLKKVNLDDLRPYFISMNKCRPSVFLSYSWSPPSNQQNVFALVSKLEKDGVRVIYDKKDLHPGQDMNYFMEKALISNEIDGVVIVSNVDYAKKADNRHGGVGYESELILNEIKNKPLQTKYIPVVIERDENGEMPLPKFLKTRLCIDLTQDTGYKELLDAIYNLVKDK